MKKLLFKQILIGTLFVLASAFSSNLFAQLPKSYDFQPKGEPIYVVDGVVTTKAFLQNIDKDSIEFMSVLKGVQATKKYGDKAVNGAIEIITKKDNASNNDVRIIPPVAPEPIFIVDGEEVKKGDLSNIDPNSIENMSVFKEDDAINRYGSRGKNGVIVITTKKGKSNIRLNSNGRGIPDPLYILDGVEISKSDLEKLDKDKIEKMVVIKEKNATDKYGDKAKNGVVEIYSKK